MATGDGSIATRAVPEVTCASRLADVVVHGRGAVVTRRADVLELEDGPCVVRIDGITPLAKPGSWRAAIRAEGRRIISVRSQWMLPKQLTELGHSVKDVRALEHMRARLKAELDMLSSQRTTWGGAQIATSGERAWLARGPRGRIDDALALAELVDARLERLDSRILELTRALDELDRELLAARVNDAQRSTTERAQNTLPTWSALLHIEGTGQLEQLELSYVVDAARWWPRYTMRLGDGGRKAELSVEALVVQDTGEDWGGVQLGLSTAELLYDARLPELPALKLGKAQPARSSGYREPPQGLSRLFQSYDESLERLGGGSPPTSMPKPAPVAAPAPVAPPEPEPLALWDEIAASEGAMDLDDDFSAVTFGAMAPGNAGPPPAPQAMMAPDMPLQAAMAPPRSRSALPSFGFGGSGAPAPKRAKQRAELRREQMVLEAEPPLEPADAWLDFDALEMGNVQSHKRGRLKRGSLPSEIAPMAVKARGALTRAEQRAQRAMLHDPVETRGLFDHRYDASAAADIPSDGALHRVDVVRAEGDSALFWRTIPLEQEEVFRLARVKNPHGVPLLRGPVDVFVEGSFLLSTTLDKVDIGGDITIGLGVDERIQVARNVRHEEENFGLISGRTGIDHDVTIELTSSLGFDADVEVLDRIPTASSHQDEVTVEALDKESPVAEDYNQSDRGRPIEGGKRWVVTLGPGQTRMVRHGWRIELSSKSEIIGGNRRD